MDAIEHPYDLSIVATVYNDSALVLPLVQGIRESLQELGPDFRYEILLVDDASIDASEAAIAEACRDQKQVKGVHLAHNVGQQRAISAGVDYATGRFVLVMDGDLQHPPSEIPRLYEKIQEGYEVVYAVSKERNNFVDRATSAFFWFVLNEVCGAEMVPNQLMFRIMSAKFADTYRRYREHNRFVAGICEDVGMRWATVPIENQRRPIGRTNYSFFKRLNLFLEILLSVTTAPLNFMIYLALGIFTVSIAGAAYHWWNILFRDVPPGFTSVVLSILFFGSLTLLLLGVIGRYLAYIYQEVRERPLYTVEALYNLDFPPERPQRGW